MPGGGGHRQEARLSGEHAGAPLEVLEASEAGKPLRRALTIRALSGLGG